MRCVKGFPLVHLILVKSRYEFIDDILEFSVRPEGRGRFGLMEGSLTDRTKGTSSCYRLKLLDILDDTGATKGVQGGAVNKGRCVNQISSAEVAGNPLV